VKRPRIVVADNHPLILSGIRAELGSFCDVVREVPDGRSLVSAALKLRPDLVILDIGMPLLNGIDAGRQIIQAWPGAKLLFLTMHDNPIYLQEAFRIGASGYVLKSSPAEELRTAVRSILRGKRYIAQAFDPGEVEKLPDRSSRRHREFIGLTDRQREILQLVAEGHGNKEIATILKISIKTVEFHRTRIMQRFRIHSAAELGKLAVQVRVADLE
jgi:DNA-binding NarL/FixJ family response regulator